MVVLLPKKVDGLAALEKTLSADKVSGWLGKLHEQEVIVSLPKFKMTTGALGAYSEGWAPLYVFETVTNQVAVYRVSQQSVGTVTT